MQSHKSARKGERRNIENSSSYPDSRLMNENSSSVTLSFQSPLFPSTASPPKAVVNIRGHTLIKPNSTLARAIVMGNQESVQGTGHNGSQTNNTTSFNQTSNFQNHSVSTTMTPRSANLPAAKRQHDQQNSDTKKPISNLPALLNQNYYSNEVHEVLLHDVQVSEADSASGPAPPPPPSPPTGPLLGRSAPNFYTHTQNRDRQERLHPPAQLTRPFQVSSAAEVLSTDKVRRYGISGRVILFDTQFMYTDLNLPSILFD